jgi:hypothetical protein
LVIRITLSNHLIHVECGQTVIKRDYWGSIARAWLSLYPKAWTMLSNALFALFSGSSTEVSLVLMPLQGAFKGEESACSP